VNEHQSIAPPESREALTSAALSPGLFLPRCAFFAF